MKDHLRDALQTISHSAMGSRSPREHTSLHPMLQSCLMREITPTLMNLMDTDSINLDKQAENHRISGLWPQTQSTCSSAMGDICGNWILLLSLFWLIHLLIIICIDRSPGRYMASDEIRLMLGHILLHYDITTKDGGPRPKNIFFQKILFPDMKAVIILKQRSGIKIRSKWRSLTLGCSSPLHDLRILIRCPGFVFRFC